MVVAVICIADVVVIPVAFVVVVVIIATAVILIVVPNGPMGRPFVYACSKDYVTLVVGFPDCWPLESNMLGWGFIYTYCICKLISIILERIPEGRGLLVILLLENRYLLP